MSSQKLKWTRGQIEVLIEAYRMERCLYETSHPNYHNKRLRAEALQRVCDALQFLRPGVDEKECQAKFQNLRSQFNVEKAKCRNSEKSGVDVADRYVPGLWYYPLLEFLEQHCGIRNRTKSTRYSDSDPFQDTQDIGSAESDAYLEELELPDTSLMTTQETYRSETPFAQDPQPATPSATEPHSAASSSRWKPKKRRNDDFDDENYSKAIQALTKTASTPIVVEVNHAEPPSAATSIDPVVQAFTNFIAQVANRIECPTRKLRLMAQVVQMVTKARLEEEESRRSNIE